MQRFYGADRVVRPYKRLSWISVWDVEDAVPYEICHCEERSDAAIRSPQLKETDSHASDVDHWLGMTGVG